ncbi:hypothetical protein D3C80_1627410 [compost metagenome]
MPISRQERIALIFERLSAASPCSTAEEMFDVLSTIMNDVEDAHSGVPADPSNWRTDGRLYPPQEDERQADPVPGVRRYRSKGHWTDISEDGALRIMRRPDGPVELTKRSATNTEVPNA